MSKEQQNKNRLCVLAHIKELHERFENDTIEYNFKETASLDGAPVASVQRWIIRQLHKEGIIKILHEIPETLEDGISVRATADRGGFTIALSGFKIEIQHPQFDEIFNEQGAMPPKNIIIRSVRLDRDDFFLDINNGEDDVRFNAKAKGLGRGKMTKRFKLFQLLWDSRAEFRNNKPTMKGEFISIENLRRVSGSISDGAIEKEIHRLNKKFEMKGLHVLIDGINKKYQLKIYMN